MDSVCKNLYWFFQGPFGIISLTNHFHLRPPSRCQPCSIFTKSCSSGSSFNNSFQCDESYSKMLFSSIVKIFFFFFKDHQAIDLLDLPCIVCLHFMFTQRHKVLALKRTGMTESALISLVVGSLVNILFICLVRKPIIMVHC